MKSVIALVGRPNVGKSTLFNRLSVGTKAIVHDLPGVTRDRKYSKAKLGPVEFTVVDTPGLEKAERAALEERMMGQTFAAVTTSDLVCLVVDGGVGITPDDQFFANMLRRQHNNVILVVNKCEKKIILDKEFYKLGFGEPVCISAEHGLGMMELCEIFLEKLKDTEVNIEDPFKSKSIQMAICGRPNAGKSTFINSLIGEHRLLTGPEAGITRDSVDIDWEYKGKNIKLVDTAGLRRKSQISKSLEKLSVSDTMYSIRFANVVILMIDATLGLEQQDLNIANYIINEGRAIVLAVNKWDLIEDKQAFKEEFDYRIETDLSHVKGIQVVFLSSINKQNIHKVIESAIMSFEVWNKKISTSKLNQWIEYTTEHHQLPLAKNGKRVRIKYVLQTKQRPPTFKFFVNHVDGVNPTYQKYLINSLREVFDLPGVPIRIDFDKTENPYSKKKK